MTSCLPSVLGPDVRRVIGGLFGRVPPWRFIWREETAARARRLASVPLLGQDFVSEAEGILRSGLGSAEISVKNEANGYSWGHAWAIEAFSSDLQVTYAFVVCAFYPVATPRPYTSMGDDEGLDRDWKLDTGIAADLAHVRQFRRSSNPPLARYAFRTATASCPRTRRPSSSACGCSRFN